MTEWLGLNATERLIALKGVHLARGRPNGFAPSGTDWA
jgi:hypothetical protein